MSGNWHGTVIWCNVCGGLGLAWRVATMLKYYSPRCRAALIINADEPLDCLPSFSLRWTFFWGSGEGVYGCGVPAFRSNNSDAIQAPSSDTSQGWWTRHAAVFCTVPIRQLWRYLYPPPSGIVWGWWYNKKRFTAWTSSWGIDSNQSYSTKDLGLPDETSLAFQAPGLIQKEGILVHVIALLMISIKQWLHYYLIVP
jgi:hypothetical protein